MNKVLATLFLLALSLGLANGGDKASVLAPAPQDPSYFAPGFELGAFVAGAFPESGGDELGGGASLAYFFTENVGIDMSYAVFAFAGELHTVTADLALRYPISDGSIAPYLLLGGGVATNGDTDGLYRVGGGLDFRLQGMGNLGIFADGVYNWVEGDSSFTIARFGVRIPF